MIIVSEVHFGLGVNVWFTLTDDYIYNRPLYQVLGQSIAVIGFTAIKPRIPGQQKVCYIRIMKVSDQHFMGSSLENSCFISHKGENDIYIYLYKDKIRADGGRKH